MGSVRRCDEMGDRRAATCLHYWPEMPCLAGAGGGDALAWKERLPQVEGRPAVHAVCAVPPVGLECRDVITRSAFSARSRRRSALPTQSRWVCSVPDGQT